MTINILAGMAIKPREEDCLFNNLVRVLHVENQHAVVINIKPSRSKNRLYFTAPSILNLSAIRDQIALKKLILLETGVRSRPDVLATDEELDKKYLRPGQTVSASRQKRHERYELIKPLVENHENRVLLFDPQIRHEKVEAHAKTIENKESSFQRLVKKISETLYQFFAEGSTVSALTPYSATQGGRGKAKNQRSKLGRKNIATKNNIPDEEGFMMTEKDKDICGFCWQNFYIRNKTISKAYRKMQLDFYSNIEIDDSGNSHHKIKSRNQKPSRWQFQYWGEKMSDGDESWKKQYTKLNLNRLARPLFGTSDGDVVAVGQLGAVDSTSNDVELVSVINHIERIGSANRILVVDSMFNYIPGFYMGLEASSADTVGLAFLHALSDKTEWLKWLGLENQYTENWIPIRFGNVIADNTDARSKENFSKLHSIGTGVKYIGVARSDLNSPVETVHHTLHRLVDHNLLGTTYGKKHERGEEHAYVLARHTIIQAIRETARAIYTHNTMELDITPTLEMRRDLIDKGIKLTRANLTRWKIKQGKCHTSLMSEDEARINLMIPIKGTFTQHGIKLLRPDTGAKREFIEPIRYISNHTLIIEKVMRAKMRRSNVAAESHDDLFLHNPYKPTEIYYKDLLNGELIKLTIATKDTDLPYECSIPDLINLMKHNALYSFDVSESRNQALCDLEASQEQTKNEASASYDDALAKLKKAPSKSSLNKNKAENREKEKGHMMYGMPIQTPNSTQSDENQNVSQDSSPLASSPKVKADGPSTNEQTHTVSASPTNVLMNTILKRRGDNANV